MSMNPNVTLALALLQTYGKPVTAQSVQDATIIDPVQLFGNVDGAVTRSTIIDLTKVLTDPTTIVANEMQEQAAAQWPNGFFNAAVRGTANGQTGWIRGFSFEPLTNDEGTLPSQDNLNAILASAQLVISSNGNQARSTYLRTGYRFTRNTFVPAAAELAQNGQPSQDSGPVYVFQSPIPWACSASSRMQLRFTVPLELSANFVFIITLYPVLAALTNPTDADTVQQVMTAEDPSCDNAETQARKVRQAKAARNARAVAAMTTVR